ncbi:hypothetical protein EBZ39_03150 [bacterium]|nr:hypothetical protein [bacterium]
MIENTVARSFLQKLVNELMRLSKVGTTRLLVLVKPQFELPMGQIPEGGVVEDEALQLQAVIACKTLFEKHGATVLGMSPAQPKGAQGNQEYFLYLHA